MITNRNLAIAFVVFIVSGFFIWGCADNVKHGGNFMNVFGIVLMVLGVAGWFVWYNRK